MFIGVDCGLDSGAVGVISQDGKYIDCFMIENDRPSKSKRNPDTELKKDTGRIDVKKLFDRILAFESKDSFYVIEDVFIMPNQSATAQAKYMRAVGAIETAFKLSATDSNKIILVKPAQWKRDMSLSKEKELSLDLARKLFPEAPLSRKKDHNLAEALLLAEWLRRAKAKNIFFNHL